MSRPPEKAKTTFLTSFTGMQAPSTFVRVRDNRPCLRLGRARLSEQGNQWLRNALAPAPLGCVPKGWPRMDAHGDEIDALEAFALDSLAFELARSADRFGGFASPTLRRFLVVPPQLHFSENTLPLHLFFERFERLIDIVISHKNLHWVAFSYSLLLLKVVASVAPLPEPGRARP